MTLGLNLVIFILGYAVTESIQYVPHFPSNLRRWLSAMPDKWKMPLKSHPLLMIGFHVFLGAYRYLGSPRNLGIMTLVALVVWQLSARLGYVGKQATCVEV